MSYEIGKDSALIVADVQKDFCPGGSLPVPHGDKVVSVLNKYIQLFKEVDAPVYATRDWHPPNHISFKSQGGLWPPHCVQNTEGAKFHEDLKLPERTIIVSKATDPNKEAYSGFDGTTLGEELRRKGVSRVFVGGLATEYCVKNTVLDALELGFETALLEDAIQGLDVRSGDSEKAVEMMKTKGAWIVTYSNLMSRVISL
jgi:nicotinamidase/pyrazinamidase